MLKLHPPRYGEGSCWRIRGTYLGIRVSRSSGETEKERAFRVLTEIADSIKDPKPPGAIITFLQAANAYIDAGRSGRYVERLGEYFAHTPIAQIDANAVNAAAAALHPKAGPATRNRCVYTPVSAILRHAGVRLELRRPKGAKGKVRTDYLNPDDAIRIVEHAHAIDLEFGLLVTFLLYSGCRIGEALALDWADIQNGTAYIRTSKNDDPRTVRLRADLASDLEPRRKPEGRVFRWRYGGGLTGLLRRATCLACGVTPPRRHKASPHRLGWVTFHTFRHTWATWFRQTGGDVQGLVATGNWRDAKSAARYAHVVPRDEWDRVEMMPDVRRKG